MNGLNAPVPIALAILTFLAASHAGGAELGKSQVSQNQGASSGPSSSGSQSSMQQSMLTEEQRTKLRPILQRSDAPKATQTNFALTPGSQVPTTIKVAPATPELVSIHPEWKDYQYFVANDQIIVVDRQHKIVETLNVN